MIYIDVFGERKIERSHITTLKLHGVNTTMYEKLRVMQEKTEEALFRYIKSLIAITRYNDMSDKEIESIVIGNYRVYTQAFCEYQRYALQCNYQGIVMLLRLLEKERNNA